LSPGAHGGGGGGGGGGGYGGNGYGGGPGDMMRAQTPAGMEGSAVGAYTRPLFSST